MFDSLLCFVFSHLKMILLNYTCFFFLYPVTYIFCKNTICDSYLTCYINVLLPFLLFADLGSFWERKFLEGLNSSKNHTRIYESRIWESKFLRKYLWRASFTFHQISGIPWCCIVFLFYRWKCLGGFTLGLFFLPRLLKFLLSQENEIFYAYLPKDNSSDMILIISYY